MPRHMEDHSETLMYADDIVLLIGKSRADQFEVDNFFALNMAVQYCHYNYLMVKTN